MGSMKTILKKQYKSNTNTEKKLFYWSILEEKICAFKHDINTKNIGEIHIYYEDTSILTEKNEKRKCIHRTYFRYSYLVFIRNYFVVVIFP
jgi:hypothetical protein